MEGSEADGSAGTREAGLARLAMLVEAGVARYARSIRFACDYADVA
jgi:hypothetical protein